MQPLHFIVDAFTVWGHCTECSYWLSNEMWFYVFQMNENRICTVEKNFLFISHINFRLLFELIYCVNHMWHLNTWTHYVQKQFRNCSSWILCWKYENSIWNSQNTVVACFVLKQKKECNKWIHPRDITVYVSNDQQVRKWHYFQLLHTFPQWKYSSQTFWWHKIHFGSVSLRAWEQKNTSTFDVTISLFMLTFDEIIRFKICFISISEKNSSK